MQGANITAIALVSVVAFAGIYDITARVFWGPEATVTTIVQSVARQHPILPFAVGVLMGHLFWP